jgi:excisionase family DNA binding protein
MSERGAKQIATQPLAGMASNEPAGDTPRAEVGQSDRLIDLESAPLRTAAHLSRLLNISEKSILQYARDGRLPSVRIGKHVRFVVAEIEAEIASSRFLQ